MSINLEDLDPEIADSFREANFDINNVETIVVNAPTEELVEQSDTATSNSETEIATVLTNDSFVIQGTPITNIYDGFVNTESTDDFDVYEESVEEVSDNIIETGNYIDHIADRQNLSEERLRYNSADWFDKINELSVTLVGVGGIGSWVSLLLSRTNVRRITCFDPDKFEKVNMAGQFVSQDQIGDNKTRVASQNAYKFSNFRNFITHTRKFEDIYLYDDILITGLDNMAGRRKTFEIFKFTVDSYKRRGDDLSKLMYIDGRLTAEQFQIFVLFGTDSPEFMNSYEEQYLFNDSEVTEPICSYKQTSYAACMIASYIVNYVVAHASNLAGNSFPRTIPFYTEVDCVMNYIEFK